jgi:hypothetical protein
VGMGLLILDLTLEQREFHQQVALPEESMIFLDGLIHSEISGYLVDMELMAPIPLTKAT